MKTYLAFCDEFPVEFEAKSDEDAAKLCEFWGWKLHDLPEDSLIAEAMIEKLVENVTLH